jgi:hypothetical protein
MNRRGTVLLIGLSSVLSVALAVAVNVATGGSLPGAAHRLQWLAWPLVAALLVAVVVVSVWQARTGGGAPDGAAGRPVVRPAELPLDVPRFTGRDAEFDALLAAVPRHPAVGIGAPVVLGVFGAGGVGKTVLANRLAHTVAARYPDGQLFVTLRGASSDPADPAEVLRRLLHTLGVAPGGVPEDRADRTAMYRSLLADCRMLLFCDDAGYEDQVRPLLPGARGCLVIVTARPSLLALPLTAWRNLELLSEAAALALLAQAVGDDRVADDLEAARRVVQYCGYLPLALAIAGARLRVRPHWTVAELARRLSSEYRRLDELSTTGRRDVRATFALSYADLDPVAATLFRRVSLLGYADFGRGVASALLGGKQHLRAAENALERLAEVRLVEVTGPLRFRLHDLVRLYAAERLDAEEPEAARRDALRRGLAYYLLRCRDNWRLLADPASAPEQRAEAEEWFDRSRTAVVTAVHRAAEVGEPRLARDLAEAVTPYLDSHDYPVDLAAVSDALAGLPTGWRRAPHRPR